MTRVPAAATALLALSLCAAPALAQQAQPAPSTPPPVVSARPYPTTPFPSARSGLDLQQRLFAEQQTRIALSHTSRERINRATRVGALIDQGLCGPAAQLARAEHDDVMADRVPMVCASHRTQRRM